MKKSTIIIALLLVLAGTAFTAVQQQSQPKNKTGFCCKKTVPEKKGGKSTTPMPYLPVVNFF